MDVKYKTLTASTPEKLDELVMEYLNNFYQMVGPSYYASGHKLFVQTMFKPSPQLPKNRDNNPPRPNIPR